MEYSNQKVNKTYS